VVESKIRSIVKIDNKFFESLETTALKVPETVLEVKQEKVSEIDSI
jgi:hypothetical protein